VITFASPGLAVAAASAISLPILIHLLLRRRRRPVEWAAMDLLREALRRVERTRRIERWLLLAVRCLLVATAGLAIAAPLVGGGATSTRAVRTLAVVIDDGAASAERIGDGTSLSRSVAEARARIESLAEGDRVAVISMSRPSAETVATADHAGALRRLSAMSSTEVAVDVAGSIAAAQAVLSHPDAAGTDRRMFVASAWREGTVGAMGALGVPPGEPAAVEVLPPPEPSGGNLRITAIEAVRTAGTGPDAPASVRVTVERDRGDGPLRGTVRIDGPSLLAPVERMVELGAGEASRSVTLAASERPAQAGTSARRAVVARLSADAQPADDASATVLPSTDRLRAVVVDRRTFDQASGIDRLSQGEWVARALAPSEPPVVDVVMVDPAAFDARAAAGADLVAVSQPQSMAAAQWDALASFVERGGTAVLLPAPREDAQGWTSSLADRFGVPWKVSISVMPVEPPTALSGERTDGALLRVLGAELAPLAAAVDVVRLLPVDPGTDASAVQLRCGDGRPVLLSWTPGGARGRLILSAAAMDPSWTTLPLKPLMVPLWQELLAEARRNATASENVRVGGVPKLDRSGIAELRPVAPDGGALPGARSIAVGAGGRASMAVERSGLYELVDARGASQGVLAATIDPSVASVRPVTMDRLAPWLASIGNVTVGPAGAVDRPGGASAPVASSDRLVPWLFAAALALALAEAWLARRFSHAVRRASIVPASARIAAGGAA
jgi:hypothetical protein